MSLHYRGFPTQGRAGNGSRPVPIPQVRGRAEPRMGSLHNPPSRRLRGIMRMSLVLATIAAAVLPAVRQPGASPSLLVLSKGDLTLSTVDPATLKVTSRVPSGPDPHEVTASTDGRVAYISNYGGGSFNTITPVDLVAQKAMPAIDLGALRGPHGLVFVGGK